MINLLLSLLVAGLFVVWVGVTSSWVGGLVLGLVAGLVAYVFLARRAAHKLQGDLASLEKHVVAQRFDAAIQELERARRWGKWQFGVNAAIDSQIGSIRYAFQQDLDGARPYLERAPAIAWHAQAMLAALHFRQKRYDEAKQVFERALKKSKKNSLLWSAYAWCEWKRGDKDAAQAVLARAVQQVPNDEKVKKNLLALQNQKKLKMDPYGAEWWALHLEKPPMQKIMPVGHASQFHPAFRRMNRKRR